MTTLMQASQQWASRPSDQRFVSLLDLDNHVTHVRSNSKGLNVSSRALQAQPLSKDDDPSDRSLVVTGPGGTPTAITHFAFGQLAQRAGAPAGYLRDIPASIAADCINYGLQHREIDDVGVLLYKNGGPAELRAVTGPNYGRVWNSTITKALIKQFGDGINGDFRVPGEFGKQVDVTKDNTTIYASDRDMFVFLADEKHRIELPNRRDGKPGSLARGFFVWNSEVGAQSFGVATFLFDYVCCNRIVWGAEQVSEIRLRHTASAPDKWIQEVAPAIQSYANGKASTVVKAIEDARSKKLDDVSEFLAKRFTRGQVSAIQAAHMADEQRPIETLWDAATGITAYARGVGYQDERVKLEREAGKVLKLAA